MLKEDYIMRMVDQLSRFLARIFKRARQAEFDQALAVLDDAFAEVLGPDAYLLAKVDVDSAVRMLAHPEKVAAYARLVQAEAFIYDQMGERPLATKRHQRALSLMVETIRMGKKTTQADRKNLTELLSRVAPESLSEDQRQIALTHQSHKRES